MARTFAPKILTANDLLDGDAVWWTGSNWSREITAAVVAETPEDAAELETLAAAPRHESAVVGPYVVDVALKDGAPYPVVRREAIRADREPTFDYRADAPALRKAA